MKILLGSREERIEQALNELTMCLDDVVRTRLTWVESCTQDTRAVCKDAYDLLNRLYGLLEAERPKR